MDQNKKKVQNIGTKSAFTPINYYYKQHITHQQYKSGMCIYISTKWKSEY